MNMLQRFKQYQSFKKWFSLMMLAAMLPLLTSCHLAMFDTKGQIGHEEARLIIIAAVLMLIIVIPVIIMTAVIAWRYRASNPKANYDPSWTHNTKLELFCWGIPCIIITILAILAWVTSHTLDPYRPLENKTKPLTIQAIALDWKWVFIYPEQGIATINYIEIPENTPISFEITSQGPMNSLWIPQLGGQIYAMAGMRTRLHLIGDTQGIYDGGSSNYSGHGFAGMMFKVKVDSESEFAQWVQTVKSSPDALTADRFQGLIEPSTSVPVQYFSSVAPNIFNDEIMKFMMPMPHSHENTLVME